MSNKVNKITPYENKKESKKSQVEKMFDNVSGNYDSLNRVITFGLDLRWRNKVLKIIQKDNPKNILDIATGTGDMAILYTQTNASKIVGVDISNGMLDIAKMKVDKKNLKNIIELQVGDAENLKFEDNSFDVISVSYGIRNFEDLDKGLKEMLRVLKPNGLCIILETSVPTNPVIKLGYLFHSKVILPLIGKLFSKDKRAYSYLSESARAFPYGKEFKKRMESIGYSDVSIKPQAGGVSSIYTARK